MLYNADGQRQITIVNGSSYTGLYAADGTWNGVLDVTPAVLKGAQHPCGALNVQVTTDPFSGTYAPDGSRFVIASSNGYALVGGGGSLSVAISPSYPTLRTAYNAGYGMIGFIGDSLFAGWGAGTTSANAKNTTGAYALSSPAVTRQQLASRGLTAIDGCIPPDNAINLGIGGATSIPVTAGYDGRRAFGTGMTINATNTAAGGYMPQINAAGTGYTVTPITPFDTVEIWWMDQPTGMAQATVKIDGVIATTYTPSAVNAIQKTTTNTTLGLHVITIDRVGAVDSVFPVYIRTKNSAVKQLAVANLGMVGAKATDWLVNTNVWSPLNMIPQIAAHLWIIQLGVNDFQGAVSAATFSANLQTLITACKVTGDVQLIVPTPADIPSGYNIPQAYIDVYTALSTSNNLPAPIDLNALFVSYLASSTDYFDGIHLKASGYTRVGQAIASRLVSGSSSSAFTPASLVPELWVEARSGGLFQSNAGATAATANGNVVGYLFDQSGRGKHQLSVADDTTRPTLQGVGVNPYISFDGTNDLLTSAAINSYGAGSASWFFAMRSNSAVNFATIAAEASTATAIQFYDLMQRWNSGTGAGAGINNDANTALIVGSPQLQAGVYDNADHVFGVVDTGTSVIPYLDGVAGTPIAYTRSGVVTLNNFSLGALRRSTAILFAVARVYSAVCVNRVLTAGEIANLTTYLGATQGRIL